MSELFDLNIEGVEGTAIEEDSGPANDLKVTGASNPKAKPQAKPKAKPSSPKAIRVEKISGLVFEDGGGNLFYLDETKRGEYVLRSRPRTYPNPP